MNQVHDKESVLTESALTQFSYENCKNRFDTQGAAKTYSSRHISSNKGKREMICIEKALADVHKNALILDLPCGTGRLSYFIKSLGFRVLGADYSAHMIDYAKQHREAASSPLASDITFEQQDVMAIKHPDNTFSATVCNRLFHHYPTAEARRLALKELARVTQGPIIVSFFNSYSLSALYRKIKNILHNKHPIDRIPIPYHTFKKDIQACGLIIKATYYTRFGLSSQTYVKLLKK